MSRWIRILIGFLILAAVVGGVLWVGKIFNAPIPPDSVACTQEAKQCPDGSYVGRVGPNCEFAACPGADTSASSSPTSVLVQAQINKSATALGVGVLPLSVQQDNRCPVDAECVVAGTVQLKIRIHTALGDTDTMATLNVPVSTEQATVTLREVLPTPHTGVTISPSQYQFVFEIAKRAQ